MVQTPSRPLPPWAQGVHPAAPPSPSLAINDLGGHYVTRHHNGTAVQVTRVAAVGFRALLLRTPLHEDLDGAPDAYAPPIAHNNLRPLNNVAVTETSLKNATNEADPLAVFHEPPINPQTGQPPFDQSINDSINPRNTFLWTGVVSRRRNQAGRTIDDRLFLQDARRRYPVMSGNPQFPNHYAPQTATVGPDGNAVNPYNVPFSVLSTALREHGGVSLGDFGVAIRLSTMAVSGFVYGDAGGTRSNSVGEASRRLIRNLFNGRATSEAVSYIIFPGSGPSRVAHDEMIAPTVRLKLIELSRFSNLDEVLGLFYGRPLSPLARRFLPALLLRPEFEEAARRRLRTALEGVGLPR